MFESIHSLGLNGHIGENSHIVVILVGAVGGHGSSGLPVGNRLDRIEPRANKRRPKRLDLLSKPRHVAKLELITAA